MNMIYIRCICLPEVRKDRVYNIYIGLKGNSSDILYAACGCPAGKGPKGSCKHISALTYGISDFCKVFERSDSSTRTDVLQTWNRPRAKKVTPIPVDELGSRRRELTKSSRKAHILFDPRPISLRQKSSLSLEKLRCDLLVLPKESAFTTLLTAHRCGFFVHSLKGWLGASPDAWIYDPSSTNPDGIAEFKCPYSKADIDPHEACEDQSLYCSLINNKLHLKREFILPSNSVATLCVWRQSCIL